MENFRYHLRLSFKRGFHFSSRAHKVTTMKRKLENTSGADRISDLPEEIIHKIMSHLSSIDTQRFQILSRRLRSLWSTFPIIDFDQLCFESFDQSISSSSGKGSDNFLDFVHRQIRCPNRNYFGLKKFRLFVKLVSHQSDRRINEAISFAIDKGVKVLVLNIDSLKLPLCCYNLPNSVYYGKSITVLELHKFELSPFYLIQNFPSIQSLRLIHCVLRSEYNKGIKISSTKLDSIMLEDCFASACIQIEASNLQSLEFRVSDCWVPFYGSNQNFRIKVDSCGSLKCLRLEGADIRDWPADHMSRFLSVKVLSLRDCKTPENMMISKTNLEIFKMGGSTRVDINAANCKFLEGLSLHSVGVTGDWLEDCISRLGSLEFLEVSDCINLGHFNISHGNLKLVEMVNLEALESIKIEAPKLQSFIYCETPKLQLCDINISACKLIKSLTLKNASITDEWLNDRLSEFLELEKLELQECKLLRNVEIFHEQLRTLYLLKCLRVLDIKVDTGKLRSFVYSGKLIPFSLMNSGALRNAKLSITSDVRSVEHFVMLRDLVGFFGHSKYFTLSCFSDKDLIFPEILREGLVPPLYDLRNLRIEIRRSRMDNNAELVDSLLWLSPHPDVLIIAVDSKEKCIKFHYDKTDIGEEDVFCCRNQPIKCWRHYLKMVEIYNFEGSDNNRITLQDYFMKNAKNLDTIVENSKTFRIGGGES